METKGTTYMLSLSIQIMVAGLQLAIIVTSGLTQKPESQLSLKIRLYIYILPAVPVSWAVLYPDSSSSRYCP